MKNAIVVQGLGFGDEGKGSIVDYLCSTQEVDLVIRHNGGCQAAHNVVLEDGRHHCFSQFGSGTLRGVPTFLDRHVIIDPLSMKYEADHLESLGVQNPLDLVTVHPDCLITTPYHRALNRILDGINKHGSCGLGIGVTRQMWSQTGDGLRYEDLASAKILRRKLDWVRQWCIDQLINYEFGMCSRTQELKCEMSHQDILDNFTIGPKPRSSSFDYINLNTVVFEGAQGFGLDELHGTIPHTTYSDTTPTYAFDLCEGKVEPVVIGVCRSYGTRHGNGPLHSQDTTPNHDPREHNVGGFPGKFRSGRFDMELITKAAKYCKVTEFAVNHLDVKQLKSFQLNLLRQIAPITIKGYGPTAEDKKDERHE